MFRSGSESEGIRACLNEFVSIVVLEKVVEILAEITI